MAAWGRRKPKKVFDGHGVWVHTVCAMNENQWSKYNAFFLVEQARENNADAQAAALDRLEAVADPSIGSRVFVLVTNDGHWARAESIEEAAKSLAKNHASRKAIVEAALVINDSSAGVDGMGRLCAEAKAVCFSLGKLGSLGGLLK